MTFEELIATASQYDQSLQNYEFFHHLEPICLLHFNIKHPVLHADIAFSCTGKSLSEALILGSTNPHYDKRLFIDLPVQYMKTTNSEHGENMLRA